ncbi:MAG: histidine phosphatase family protein [Ruminococcus sp.]|jgi:probable phosphoglycerate mutase|nr:histidine phosphatase family protein [Ruminococcus sp.]
MKLYVVRHGETDWNKARRVQGHSDIPLNEYGIHLARQTAAGMKDIPFDMAYTSPLIRAKKTAEIILEGRNIPIFESEGIKEMGFGVYEGMCCSGEHKAADSEAFNRFFKDTGNYVPAEGGESIQALMERTGSFLKEVCEDEKLQGKHILISTHGAAMTALLNHIRGNLEIVDFWKWQVPANCAVTVVEVKDGVPAIVEENKIYYKEPVRRWSVE